MPTAALVLRNALSQIAGKVLNIGVVLVSVKLITQLGVEFYGQYMAVYEYLAFFGTLADAGLFAIAVREMSRIAHHLATPEAEKQERVAFIFHNVLAMRIVLVLVVMLVAGITAQYYPGMSPQVRTGVWITSLTMGLSIIAGTLSAPLQTAMRIHIFSFAQSLSKIVFALLVVGIIYTPQWFGSAPFFPLLWAGVAMNLLWVGILLYSVAKMLPLRLRWDGSWWRRTWSESLPYGLSLVLQTLYLRIDMLLILWLLDEAAVGIYGVGARVLESFLVLGVFFGQAILPKISSEEQDTVKTNATLGWAIEVLVLLSVPLVLSGVHFADDAVRLLSSQDFLQHPEWGSAATYLRILLPTVLFAYLNQLMTYTLVAKGRQRYMLVVNGAALLVNAGLNVLFLREYGLAAAAWSTVVAEVTVLLILSREIWRYYRPIFVARSWWLLVLLNGALWLLLRYTPVGEHLLVAMPTVMVLYLGALYALHRERLLHRG